MNAPVKSYRRRLLFIGLTVEEKTNIEIAFSRYSVFYSRDIEKVGNIAAFDLIVADDETYLENLSLLRSLSKPIFNIGTKKLEGSGDVLKRPLIVHEWLKAIEGAAKPVRTPTLSPIKVGSIVRSKTTPIFGKGVVMSIENETEVMVRFPMNKILPPNKALRCHISQLQILGNIEDKNSGAKL